MVPAPIDGMPSTEQVRALEHYMMDLPQVDVSTQNLIHGRMCARTIMIPADTILTGAQTNADNICIVCGDITVTTSVGMQRLTGFHVLPAMAGFKRAGVAHADTYWTTVHHTDFGTLEEIEREMTDESHLLQSSAQGITNQKAEEKACLG